MVMSLLSCFTPCCCSYDQVSKQWAVVAAMSSERKHLGVAALGGLLYAVGGRDQTTELNTVER